MKWTEWPVPAAAATQSRALPWGSCHAQRPGTGTFSGVAASSALAGSSPEGPTQLHSWSHFEERLNLVIQAGFYFGWLLHNAAGISFLWMGRRTFMMALEPYCVSCYLHFDLLVWPPKSGGGGGGGVVVVVNKHYYCVKNNWFIWLLCLQIIPIH